jgi:hypothetical protein
VNILIINLLLGCWTIGVAYVVLHIWSPHARSNASVANRLLLIGISISFLGTIGDNIYWGLTWLSKLKGWPSEAQWFNGGPYANTLFRHCMKIAAAACHLEAARRADIVKTAELSRLLWSVVLLGFLVFLFLLTGT